MRVIKNHRVSFEFIGITLPFFILFVIDTMQILINGNCYHFVSTNIVVD